MFLKYLILATEKNKMKSTSLSKSEEIVQVIKKKKRHERRKNNLVVCDSNIS